MTFKDLGLSESILRAVDKQGYTTPSPIQQKAIPLILQGKDVLASAQTGTGKTAGFTLPLLHILSENPKDTKKGEISELHTKRLELDIIRQPEIWLWSHKRWKKTKEEVFK